MYYLKAGIEKPLNFISAGNFKTDRPWKHTERVIKEYEIIIVVRGSVYIQQDDIKYELKPGNSLLLLPNHIHKGYDYSGKGTSFYWCHFECKEPHKLVSFDEAAAFISITNNNRFFDGLVSDILIPAYSNALNLERISVLFHQLLHVLTSKYYSNNGVNYILTMLLIELTEQTILNFRGDSRLQSPNDNLQRILEWIRIHSTSDISLAKVAHEFNYSREYLSRYFKRKMGMNLQQYIHNLKLSKAKELLCESDKSITEIANYLGFKDEKYFMKLFKKVESTTAKQYRNAYNLTHLNNQ